MLDMFRLSDKSADAFCSNDKFLMTRGQTKSSATYSDHITNEENKMDSFLLRWGAIHEELVGDIPDFPKYTTQIMNLANQNSQGTRPKVVGQMSDLIVDFSGNTYSEWVDWYESVRPDAIEDATNRVFGMVEKLKESIQQIDRAMVEQWVRDLVLTKTFTGFRFQQAILRELGRRLNQEVVLASASDESRGIDGYVGGKPVSIKPSTYRQMSSLPESISVPVIFFDKTKTGVLVDPSEL